MKYIIIHRETGVALLTDNAATLFDSPEDAEAYLRKHSLREKRFEIKRYF